MIQKKNAAGIIIQKSKFSQINVNPEFYKFKKLRDEFDEITGINLFNFIDKLLFKTGILTIDIILLDDYIINKYGDYMKDNMSMREFIEYKFNKRAADIIAEIIDNITECYGPTNNEQM